MACSVTKQILFFQISSFLEYFRFKFLYSWKVLIYLICDHNEKLLFQFVSKMHLWNLEARLNGFAWTDQFWVHSIQNYIWTLKGTKIIFPSPKKALNPAIEITDGTPGQ